MTWPTFVVFLSIVTAGSTINRPVYKIILKQKGFAQFLQYDVETPPLREFTFCTWVRLYDLSSDQSIFSYVTNSNKRVVRLWLDSGGRHIKVTINEKVRSSIPVEIVKDVWRHVCLSYQSDFGAWAVYVDSRLISCEAAQSLNGFVIPGGGRVIIGYGTAENGDPSGVEGEIFGANMILSSTIERNYTLKIHPQYEQRTFERNKVKMYNNRQYIVLDDLQTDEIHNNFENTMLPPSLNATKNYIKVKTPYSFVEHEIGIKEAARKPKQTDSSIDKEILDLIGNDDIRLLHEKNKNMFWNVVNQAGHAGKFRVLSKSNTEQSGSSTQELPTISEYETPPPVPSSIPKLNTLPKSLGMEKTSEYIFKINEEKNQIDKNILNKQLHKDEISEVELPPPPDKETKVYGQWTSSKFAGNVLNYLKSINFHSKEKKVPLTIPLTKTYEPYPYASELKVNIVRPPMVKQYQKRNLIIEKRYRSQNTYVPPSPVKRIHITKREAKKPQINVQILEDDLRSNILKSHAKARPKQVEVTIRGETKKDMNHRFYRNADTALSVENYETEDLFKPRPFSAVSNIKNNHRPWNNFDLHKSNSFLTVLPFIKSVEYFTEEFEQKVEPEQVVSNDMYTKSLSNGNKWHNVKSYSNDFTPRHINMNPGDGKSDIEYKIAEVNKKNPSVRLKYKPEINRIIKNNEDATILKGRELALKVSNQSNYNRDSISILKYNHGFLPGHHDVKKSTKKANLLTKIKSNPTNTGKSKNGFDKHVKLGNALNEQHVIGISEEQKMKSFVGGNEKIPDINRYRSDIDNETSNVPSSLKPNICKNIELYDHILYVQPDGSIDMTHILSPVKAKNIGIDFILQNYKKCSLEESTFKRNSLLMIHWSKTPVRLFGGAYPKKTTDLCGFF